ncbi:hypothetical protein COV11_04525 [Candidatus Woesearchaeota archaeon CG10_big_fil_rev_8_21_14_0_10_30_7]|nr:MAG: hypothetical protein COV11_04525 [Candidatus Woesearchaeota archaeon CG10_big_fil_rev_8_21_14_0_10_30_7]
MLKKIATALCFSSCLMPSVLAQEAQEVSLVDHLRRYDYDIIHDKILELDLGDASINVKQFELADFSEYYNVDDISGKLSHLLRNYSMNELYTMEFNFDITDDIIGSVVEHWYDDALFKSVTVVEDGRVRPLFHVASLNPGDSSESELKFVFYDREDFTVEFYDENMTLVGFDNYDEQIFKDILDPLSLIAELDSKQPNFGDRTLYVGKFYNTNGDRDNRLFDVNLKLINDHGWKGEICLPPKVFLKQSMYVRIEYNKQGTKLVPSVTNKMFLKPATGITSFVPGWAYTKYKE